MGGVLWSYVANFVVAVWKAMTNDGVVLSCCSLVRTLLYSMHTRRRLLLVVDKLYMNYLQKDFSFVFSCITIICAFCTDRIFS